MGVEGGLAMMSVGNDSSATDNADHGHPGSSAAPTWTVWKPGWSGKTKGVH